MAKTAVIGLTDHVESIRREAYNEGYAAAMRAVAEFSTSRTAKPTVTKATASKAIATKATKSIATKATKATAIKAAAAKSTTATTAAPKRKSRTQAKPAPRRTRRGDNARRIAQAMMALPDHSGPAAAIKKTLAEKGHDLPYTSIRHGLGQLQARGEASVAADGKTWSYTAPAS
jgi:DNA-binding protein HU-beta